MAKLLRDCCFKQLPLPMHDVEGELFKMTAKHCSISPPLLFLKQNGESKKDKGAFMRYDSPPIFLAVPWDYDIAIRGECFSFYLTCDSYTYLGNHIRVRKLHLNKMGGTDPTLRLL